MNVGPGHISPGTLELLQIRALHFHDTADELLALLEQDQQGESMAEDSSVSLSVQESVSVLLAELVDSERRRASLPKAPDWYGPGEQLLFAVGHSGNALMDHAEQMFNERESHHTHDTGCRCDELADLLHERIYPALDEFRDLLDAIEQLRRRWRSQFPNAPPRIRKRGAAQTQCRFSPVVTVLVTALNASGCKYVRCRAVRDMLDRLTQQGELPRVQLLLGNRNVRKVSYDRADLDRLVELSRIV
jgi:hypothetical protein